MIGFEDGSSGEAVFQTKDSFRQHIIICKQFN